MSKPNAANKNRQKIKSKAVKAFIKTFALTQLLPHATIAKISKKEVLINCLFKALKLKKDINYRIFLLFLKIFDTFIFKYGRFILPYEFYELQSNI